MLVILNYYYIWGGKNMNLKFSNEKDCLIMSVYGEIDHRYAIRIRNEADKKIVTYPNKDFVIDLTGVTFMDSSGIALILRAQQRMQLLDGIKELQSRPC